MQPKAILWFQIYCGILVVMYLLVSLAGVAFFFVPASAMEVSETEKWVIAGAFVVFGIPLMLASAVPFFVGTKPWVWIYGVILIALGLTSCCFWPLCIPLLIFWLKPEVQRHFGRTA